MFESRISHNVRPPDLLSWFRGLVESSICLGHGGMSGDVVDGAVVVGCERGLRRVIIAGSRNLVCSGIVVVFWTGLPRVEQPDYCFCFIFLKR